VGCEKNQPVKAEGGYSRTTFLKLAVDQAKSPATGLPVPPI
jgi:hypothetical protein